MKRWRQDALKEEAGSVAGGSGGLGGGVGRVAYKGRDGRPGDGGRATGIRKRGANGCGSRRAGSGETHMCVGACVDVHGSTALAADAGCGEGQDLESLGPAENNGPAVLEQALLWEVGSCAPKDGVGSVGEGGPAGGGTGGCGGCYWDGAGQQGGAGHTSRNLPARSADSSPKGLEQDPLCD